LARKWPNLLVWIPQRFSNLVILHLSAYEDGTECSETSAYKIQTPGNYPEENIQNTEHSESLKSRLAVLLQMAITRIFQLLTSGCFWFRKFRSSFYHFKLSNFFFEVVTVHLNRNSLPACLQNIILLVSRNQKLRNFFVPLTSLFHIAC
jgi:hypothetical protein